MLSLQRNPFARGEYVRRIVHCATSCHECGQFRRRLYAYDWVPDDRAHRPLSKRGAAGKTTLSAFCNFKCFSAYWGD